MSKYTFLARLFKQNKNKNKNNKKPKQNKRNIRLYISENSAIILTKLNLSPKIHNDCPKEGYFDN